MRRQQRESRKRGFRAISCFALSAFCGRTSAFEEHPPVQPSPGLVSMLESVDGIYVINLDRSKDRLKRISQQLKDLGAGSKWKRVRAVDGSLLSSTASAVTGTKTYHYGGLSIKTWDVEALEEQDGANGGRAAVTASHLKAACMVYKAGHSSAMVFEDDVNLTHEDELGARDVAAVLKALPEDFTVLQLSATITTRPMVERMKAKYDLGFLAAARDPCTSDWVSWGTFAYIISRKGAVQLLQRYWPQALLQYDDDNGAGGSDGSEPYDVCSGGSGPSWPVGLRGSFDWTGVTNFLTDYWLYRMEGVYLMTRPAMLTPNGFSSMYDQEDANAALLWHSRALSRDVFSTGATDGTGGQVKANVVYMSDRRSKHKVHYTGKGFSISQSDLNSSTDGVCQAYFGPDVLRNDPRCAYLMASLWSFMGFCGDEGANYNDGKRSADTGTPRADGGNALRNHNISANDRPLDVCLVMSGYYQLVEVCESTGGAEHYCQVVQHPHICEALQEQWPSIVAKGKREWEATVS